MVWTYRTDGQSGIWSGKSRHMLSSHILVMAYIVMAYIIMASRDICSAGHTVSSHRRTQPRCTARPLVVQHKA